jgi:hypothetical protein
MVTDPIQAPLGLTRPEETNAYIVLPPTKSAVFGTKLHRKQSRRLEREETTNRFTAK